MSARLCWGLAQLPALATKLNPDSHQISNQAPHLEPPPAQAQIFSLDNTSQIREPRVGLPELNFNEAELETQAWVRGGRRKHCQLVQVRCSTLKAFGKQPRPNISRSLISSEWAGAPSPRVASPVGASSQDELWPPFRPSSPHRACAAIHKK